MTSGDQEKWVTAAWLAWNLVDEQLRGRPSAREHGTWQTAYATSWLAGVCDLIQSAQAINLSRLIRGDDSYLIASAMITDPDTVAPTTPAERLAVLRAITDITAELMRMIPARGAPYQKWDMLGQILLGRRPHILNEVPK